jgi:hypothetical protein
MGLCRRCGPYEYEKADRDQKSNMLGTAHADNSPFHGSARGKIPANREDFGCGT